MTRGETADTFCLAVLENARGEVLLLRRSAGESFAPGRWGFPGGRVEPGETPEETMGRELNEEIGAGHGITERDLVKRVGPVRDTLYGGIYEIHLFHYRGGAEVVLNDEHDAFVWVAREDYRRYAVVDGIDEDLYYLNVWPVEFLNAEKIRDRDSRQGPGWKK